MHDIIHARFDAKIDHVELVHDGDTISRVQFRLPGLHAVSNAHYGEIYPDIWVACDGVWIQENIRLAGVDTPELHPAKHYRNGDLRPADERAREHAKALEARDYVASLLVPNNLRFQLRNPQLGKYAGRMVAEIWCLEDGEMISVAERLRPCALPPNTIPLPPSVLHTFRAAGSVTRIVGYSAQAGR